LSEQLNLVSQVILTILGGIIAAATGIWIGLTLDKRHLKEKIRFDHFTQIKSNVLEPVRKSLMQTVENYTTNEQHRYDSKTYEELMKMPSHWWDYFSATESCDPILLEDLPTHFIELPPLFDEVQNLIRNRTMEYLKLRIKTSLSLADRFKKFKTPDGTTHLFPENELEMAAHAALMILMGYHRAFWANLDYTLTQNGRIDLVLQVAKEYSTGNGLEFILLQDLIRTTLDKTVKKIGQIELLPILPGNCPYIKV